MTTPANEKIKIPQRPAWNPNGEFEKNANETWYTFSNREEDIAREFFDRGRKACAEDIQKFRNDAENATQDARQSDVDTLRAMHERNQAREDSQKLERENRELRAAATALLTASKKVREVLMHYPQGQHPRTTCDFGRFQTDIENMEEALAGTGEE